MNQPKALLIRELLEHRGAMLITPVSVLVVMLTLLIMLLILGYNSIIQIDGEHFILAQQIEALSSRTPEELENHWKAVFLGTSGIFNTVLFVVLVFYLLGSLVDDRKDRSILFWKSMPVSDTATVLSKLATAAIMAPGIVIVAILACHLSLMFIAGILLGLGGGSIWQLVIEPAPVFSMFIGNIMAYAVHAFWMLPLYGWLLFASAVAKRKPFLVAIALPVGAMILENFLSMLHSFSLSDSIITPFLIDRLKHGVIPLNFSIQAGPNGISTQSFGSITDPLQRFAEGQMWLGIIIGIALIVMSIRLRRFHDEV